MSVHRMWFGNVRHAQWAPVPRPGMNRTREGSGSLEFAVDNGGLWIDDSESTHLVYEMEFPIIDNGYEGIEAYERFKAGSYGKDYLRFVDPMYQRDNLFNENWSEPGNADFRDWQSLTDLDAQFVDTPYATGNPNRLPVRSAVFSVQNLAVSGAPASPNGSFTFLVPPGNVLHLGGAGAALTSDVELRASILDSAGAVISSQPVTLQSETATPAFSTTITGQTAVRVYLTRTGSGTEDPRIRISALWAQIRPLGEPASLPRTSSARVTPV